MDEAPNQPQSDTITAPIDDPARRRLPPLLRQSWYGLNQAFRRRIAHLGMTPDQFTVMRSLLEGDPEGMTQRQVTEAMSSDPNTVASLLERMEKAGFLERKPHERDRRAHRILPLDKGCITYQQAREIAVHLQAEVLTILPESQRELFLAMLTQIGEACRQAAESSPRKTKAAP